MHDHDFVSLFAGFWWLIFPLGWGIAMLVKSIQRGRQTEKAMEIIKGYADQGKTPPPEVLALLQPEARCTDPGVAAKRERDRVLGFLLTGFIFVALCIGFAVLMHTHAGISDSDGPGGLLFVSVLMGGFAIAFFIAAYVQSRYAKKDGV